MWWFNENLCHSAHEEHFKVGQVLFIYLLFLQSSYLDCFWKTDTLFYAIKGDLFWGLFAIESFIFNELYFPCYS